MSSNRKQEEVKYDSDGTDNDEVATIIHGPRRQDITTEKITITVDDGTTTAERPEETQERVRETDSQCSFDSADVATENSFTAERFAVANIDDSFYQHPDNRTTFVANVHHEVEKTELEALFSRYGIVVSIYMANFRQNTWSRRKHGFVVFDEERAAREACRALNNYLLRDGMEIKVCMSDTNRRLYLGNIPKCKTAKHIENELGKQLTGLRKVITYKGMNGESNRGFCFLEFNNHRQASISMSRLRGRLYNIWNCPFEVDWADVMQEPSEDVMSKVKIMYISNLAQNVTEEYIKQESKVYGEVERVKKIKHYAFVHFKERSHALEAIKQLDGKIWEGDTIKAVLSKPPNDKKQMEELLQKRENRKIKAILRSQPPIQHIQTPATLFDNDVPRQYSCMPSQEPEFPSHGGQCRGAEISHVCGMLRSDSNFLCCGATCPHEVHTCRPISSHVRDVTCSAEPLYTRTEITYPCRKTTNEVPYTLSEVPHAYRSKSPKINFTSESALQVTESLHNFTSMPASGRRAIESHERERLTSLAKGFQHEAAGYSKRFQNMESQGTGRHKYTSNQSEELPFHPDERLVILSNQLSRNPNKAVVSPHPLQQRPFRGPGEIAGKVKYCTCCGASSKILK